VTETSWRRVKALFDQAVELPANEREGFLRGATPDDTLRAEVASLLATDQASGFLDRLASAACVGRVAPVAPAGEPVLVPGGRLGSYEIVSLVGLGAMSEVYRARDLTLNREVALKVLLPPLADDPDRSARFKREAQLLATLNHQNIATIYGFEEPDGTQALVMELIDGLTLAERIARGPIGIREALNVALQIAVALEAAHDKGIIHRDLKPANIKIAAHGLVKVLDFGLAKVWTGAEPGDRSSSSTGTRLVESSLRGTPAYMSPEQARGLVLDRRTDVWSFGCVLYEMLTGRAPFAGESISDTLAAMLETEPEFSVLPADTPLAVRNLLRQCLTKNPEQRLDSAATARREIGAALGYRDAGWRRSQRPRQLAFLAMAIVATVAGVTAPVAWTRRIARLTTPSPTTVRFVVTPSKDWPFNVYGSNRDLAVSADGRAVVYRAGGTETNGSPLLVRAIDRIEARALANPFNTYAPVTGRVANAVAPFFSPTGLWVGFFENGALKKVSAAGGSTIELCEIRGNPLGATWGDDDVISFATDGPNGGLWRVSARGGTPMLLASPDRSQGETAYAFPSALPNGHGVLFTIMTGSSMGGPSVAVIDPVSGRRKVVVRHGADAEYLDTGDLIFAAAGSLQSVRFDPVRLETRGQPMVVVDRVLTKPSGATNYAVAGNGTLVYQTGPAEQTPVGSLVWVDRARRERSLKAPPRAYGPPRISPDGGFVAVGVREHGNTDIWILDLARETSRRLTFVPGMNGLPLWTPDGRHVVFMSDRTGVLNLYGQRADGIGPLSRLTATRNSQWPSSISPDGRSLFGFDFVAPTGWDLIRIDLSNWRSVLAADRGAAGGRRSTIHPEETLTTGPTSSIATTAQRLFTGDFSEVSPDGRYIAYQSPESGRYEVYVRPLPSAGQERWKISVSGGTRPAWAHNGRELFYLDANNTLIAVPVRASGLSFVAGKPTTVVDMPYLEPNPARHYDVSPDGQRFLMIKGTASSNHDAAAVTTVVVEHWVEELQRLISATAR
jgi:tRNA A-37 threonylcarbamoyl transferase component Bud32